MYKRNFYILGEGKSENLGVSSQQRWEITIQESTIHVKQSLGFYEKCKIGI